MLSERIYRWLLLLYPREHRREYGELMVQLFRDRMRRDGNGFRRLAVWLHLTVDLAGAAFEEHKERTDMRKLTSIGIALAVLLVAGGIGTGVLLAQTRGEVTITVLGDDNVSTFTATGSDDVAAVMQQAVEEGAIDQQSADEIVQAAEGGDVPEGAWKYDSNADGDVEQALQRAAQEGEITQASADLIGRLIGERLGGAPSSFTGNVVVVEEEEGRTYQGTGPDPISDAMRQAVEDGAIAPEAADGVVLSATGVGPGNLWRYDGALNRVEEAVRQAVEDGLISPETADTILLPFSEANSSS